MAAEFKRYPEYKDSGMEWLGEVPAHWEVRQLGRIGRFIKGGVRYQGRRPRERHPVRCATATCTRDIGFFITRDAGIRRSRTRGHDLHANPIPRRAIRGVRRDDRRDRQVRGQLDPRPRMSVFGDIIILRPSIEADARYLGLRDGLRCVCSPEGVHRARTSRFSAHLFEQPQVRSGCDFRLLLRASPPSSVSSTTPTGASGATSAPSRS